MQASERIIEMYCPEFPGLEEMKNLMLNSMRRTPNPGSPQGRLQAHAIDEGICGVILLKLYLSSPATPSQLATLAQLASMLKASFTIVSHPGSQVCLLLY